MLLAEKLSETHNNPILGEDTLIEIVEQSSISDKLGIVGSSLCLVHCLVLPFLLPFISSADSGSHIQGFESWFHGIIFPALLLFAVSAFGRGYNIHHSKYILGLGISGIFLISIGLVAEYVSTTSVTSPESLTSIGSILLVIAHVLNILTIRTLKPHIHSALCGCISNMTRSTNIVPLKRPIG